MPIDMLTLLRLLVAMRRRNEQQFSDAFPFNKPAGGYKTHMGWDTASGPDRTAYFTFTMDAKSAPGWKYYGKPESQPDGYHSDFGAFIDLPSSEYRRIPDRLMLTKG